MNFGVSGQKSAKPNRESPNLKGTFGRFGRQLLTRHRIWTEFWFRSCRPIASGIKKSIPLLLGSKATWPLLAKDFRAADVVPSFSRFRFFGRQWTKSVTTERNLKKRAEFSSHALWVGAKYSNTWPQCKKAYYPTKGPKAETSLPELLARNHLLDGFRVCRSNKSEKLKRLIFWSNDHLFLRRTTLKRRQSVTASYILQSAAVNISIMG